MPNVHITHIGRTILSVDVKTSLEIEARPLFKNIEPRISDIHVEPHVSGINDEPSVSGIM